MRLPLIARAGPIFKEIRTRAAHDFAEGILTKADFDAIAIYTEKLQEIIWKAERSALHEQRPDRKE